MWIGIWLDVRVFQIAEMMYIGFTHAIPHLHFFLFHNKIINIKCIAHLNSTKTDNGREKFDRQMTKF
jgi:hypothetical protein